jgi:hypothetical protein
MKTWSEIAPRQKGRFINANTKINTDTEDWHKYLLESKKQCECGCGQLIPRFKDRTRYAKGQRHRAFPVLSFRENKYKRGHQPPNLSANRRKPDNQLKWRAARQRAVKMYATKIAQGCAAKNKQICKGKICICCMNHILTDFSDDNWQPLCDSHRQLKRWRNLDVEELKHLPTDFVLYGKQGRQKRHWFNRFRHYRG